MRVLLDTHVFLWFILDDTRLGRRALEVIEDPANEILISPATFWEIAIKISLGKYALPEAYEPFIESQMAVNGFQVLPILSKHTALLTEMPFHHRDPFDRLLIAQAKIEDIGLVSVDPRLDAYGIHRVW